VRQKRGDEEYVNRKSRFGKIVIGYFFQPCPIRVLTAQSLNASSPMAVTVLGMSIWCNDLHPLNALLPISLSPLYSTTCTKFMHPKMPNHQRKWQMMVF
jgi:hypothetical protein